MKSKKNSREDKHLPVHNEKIEKKGFFRRRPKSDAPKNGHAKNPPLTVEQEILRMREEEKRVAKKAENASRRKTPSASVKKEEAPPRKKEEAPPRKKGQTPAPKKAPAAKATASKKAPARRTAAPSALLKKKVRVIPLGGLGEIGKNMTVVETDEHILLVDCGMGFPDDGMPGIDLVIPDVTYLEENRHKLCGLFLTHGHEDHIGAIPYVFQKINCPIYGTKLTLGIVENKLREFGLDKTVELRTVQAGESVRCGDFDVEFISVNHSIADAVAFAIKTPAGTLVFTGDFKIDSTPIDGEMTDLTRLGELGREGVTALFCDSTNCERVGFTPSERTVGNSLEQIFHDNDKRVIVATFSSNIHRVQQIIDASVKHHRAVCILGRSMINIVNTASKLGYMRIPEGTLIEAEELKKFPPRHVTLITTGSQGESMSALSRMAYGTHNLVKLSPEDMVVISAHPIPGNEKTITGIINELMKKKVEVVYDRIAEVHVSGHACQEEIKMIFALVKPRFFMPVHGEYKHLAQNAALAAWSGIPKEHIFVSEIGKILEFSADGKKAYFGGSVASGVAMVEAFGATDVDSVVLRDRMQLSEVGMVTVVAAVESYGKYLVGDVQIVTRGFVYVKENEALIEEIRTFTARVIENSLAAGLDLTSVRTRVKEELSNFLFGRCHRRPVILTVLMEV